MGRAKQKATLTNITQATTQGAGGTGPAGPARPARVITAAPPSDPVTAKGVPLRASEWDELEMIIGEYDSPRPTLASLLSYFVRYGLTDYRAGKIALTRKGKRFISPH
jgi:hypothetical protein